MPELPLSGAIPRERYVYRQSLRSRVGAIVLALAMSLLVLTALIWVGAIAPSPRFAGSHFTSVNLGETRAMDKAHAAAAVAAPVAATAAHAVPPPVPIVLPPVVVQPPAARLPSLNLIPLTRQEMASGDIGKMARSAPGSAGGSTGAGSGKTYGPGEGPGGIQLLRAQWYREPLDAELSTYMPARAFPPGSWATIACRTIEHYHVEDCRELSESPPGSGLSRALRQAAWQFLVRPPRLDGKAQLGTWVSIRFDFIRAARKDESEDPPAAGAEGAQ